MLDRSKQTTNNSSKRVQSWLDSMYYHHSSFDEDDKATSIANSMKSSTAKLSSKSRKSSLSASSSSSNRRPSSRRVYLRKPRLLVKRFRNKKINLKNSENYSDQTSSYFSGNSDDSNHCSNSSVFLNENSPFGHKPPTDIKADDLEFDDRNSTNLGDESSSNCSFNFSTKPHSFGILDFEQWDSNLKLDDNLKFVVKMYAFELKDIKIKVKGNTLIVKGKQSIEEKDGYYKREFQKSFILKDEVDRKHIKYDFDKNDNLVISIPRAVHSVH